MTRWIAGILLLAPLALVVSASTEGAVRSSNAYTTLNLDRCADVRAPDDAAPSGAFRCRGFKNVAEFDVYVFEKDERYYVSYGRDAFERRVASQTLAPANSLGDDVEWLLERRAGDWVPYATIVRYYTEVEEDGGFYRGEVLVVSKVGANEACHVAYIDARATVNANRRAREAADELVRRFDCENNDPVIRGERGRSLGPTS